MSDHAALAGPHRPTPPVSDIDAASFASEQDLVQKIVEGLKISGGCVIRKFIGKGDLVRLEQDFAPHFAEAKPLKGMEFFEVCLPSSRELMLMASHQATSGQMKPEESRAV